MPLLQTPFEKKLLKDLFASAPKVTKALNDVIRISHHFTAVEMDLLNRLSMLFSEVSRRPLSKESEKQIDY
ncbi:MAG: hypothetical protein WC780_05365 [Lentimicrobiaceae bacterium]